MTKEKHGWKHDALASDLANRLRGNGRMVWENMQLGPSGSPRPDVYTIASSFANPKPLAYEIKVSRSDFLRDAGAGKWHSYLAYACGVIFAAPSGVIDKKDLPAGAGLMLRGVDGWRTLVAPRMRPLENMPADAWMKLLMDGVPRINAAPPSRNDGLSAIYRGNDKLKALYGATAARVIQDIDHGRDRIERNREHIAEQERKIAQLNDMARAITAEAQAKGQAAAEAQAADFKQARADLCKVLGLPDDSNIRTVQRKIYSLREALTLDASRNTLMRTLQDIQGMCSGVLGTEDKNAPFGG